MDENSGFNAGFIVHYLTDSPRLKITNSLFLNNQYYYGYVFSFKSLLSWANVELKNVKIIDSSIETSAMYTSNINLNDDTLTIRNIGLGFEALNSILAGNNLIMYNCSSIGVSLSSYSSFECENCLFDSNLNTVLFIDKSTVFINNSAFINNQVSINPVLSFISTAGPCSIFNSEIKLNQVNVSSLALVSNSDLSLYNVTVTSNTIKNYEYSGIYMTNANLTVNQSSFLDMVSELKGSFIYAASKSIVRLTNSVFKHGSSLEGNIYLSKSELIIKTCSFIQNNGGDINVESSTLTITDSVIKNPTTGSKNNWGSIVVTDCIRVIIDGCLFQDQNLKTSVSIQSFIYLDTCNSFFVDRCHLKGSEFDSIGLYLLNCKTAVIKNSIFENFSSSKYSALTAVTTFNSQSLNIRSSVFKNNTSGYSGGALYVDSYNLTLTSCNISKNHANVSGGGIFYMTNLCTTCGIYLLGNTRITENSCKLEGGGIKWSEFKPYKETEVLIQNNTALYGNDMAAHASSLSLSNSRQLTETLTQISEVIPGQEYKNEILISIKDSYGQIVTTDNSTKLTLSVNGSDSVFSVSGITVFTAVNGILTVSRFAPAGPPGEYFILKLESSIKSPKTKNEPLESENSIYLNVSFRECLAGEIIESTSCRECPKGKYLLSPGTSCKSCPSGASCEGGSSLVVDKGYWRSTSESDTVYPCEFSSACTGGTNENPLGNCEKGYAGVKCQSCEVGYSMASDYKCAKCPERSKNIAILAALILGIIIVAVILVRPTLQSAFSPKAKHSIYIKIFTNYLQLIFITTQFNLEWPSYVKELFKVQQQTATVSDQIFSVNCYLDETDSSDKTIGYYIQISLMATLPVVIFLVSYIYWVYHYFSQRNYKPLKREVYTTMIILFFLVYPNIVKSLFLHFSCIDIDQMDSYLKSNTSITCWNDKHKKFSYIVVIPGIVLWAVGFPALLLIILNKNKKCLHLDVYRIVFGFLYNGYKLSRFYWEFIIMYRKILLISISVFFSSQASLVQALTVVVVLLPSIYAQYEIRPYNSHELNHMETEALLTAVITIYCGLYFLSNSISEEFKMFLFLVIVFGNCYFILYWIYFMLQAVFDIIIKTFPQFKRILKKGDDFEENFNEEVMAQDGVFHDQYEERKVYTFLNNRKESMRNMINYEYMLQAFADVFKKEVERSID